MNLKKVLPLVITIFICLLPILPSVVGSTTPKPPNETDHQTSYISIATATMGGTVYILGFALSDIINKKSNWLRASGVEGWGTIGNIGRASDPRYRHKMIYSVNEEHYSYANKGMAPFKEKYPARFIMNLYKGAHYILTLDPNIKTLADLKGKKIITGSAAGAYGQITKNLFKAAGLLDEVKIRYATVRDIQTAITDGLADAAVGYSNWVGDRWTSPLVTQIMATARKDVYILGFTKELVKETGVISGYNFSSADIKANSFANGVPKSPVIGCVYQTTFGAYEEMPNEVVKEVLRIAVDNVNMFKEYHARGAGMNAESFAKNAIPTEYYHPAALEFYKERGIKTGLSD